MEGSVFERVEALLRSVGAEFRVLHHEPVFTSEEAARVRGVELSSGAKALVCKADDRFLVFVLPADRRLSGMLWYPSVALSVPGCYPGMTSKRRS